MAGMYWLFPLAHSVLVLALTIRVLVRQDISGSARIAWFAAFTFLPLFGSVLYILFGEVHMGRRFVRNNRAMAHELRTVLGPERLGGGEAPGDGIRPEHCGCFNYGASINGFGVARGNRIELLPQPQSFAQRLVADIDAAEGSVNILFYIWLDDKTGRAVAEAVIRAARRGLRCRIGVDAVGSRKFTQSATWKAIGAAGAETHEALQTHWPWWLLNRWDLRDHRKITVIDGRIAYVGSRNCADPEFRVKPRFAPWVDIMTRVEGPAVNQMQALFANAWVTPKHREPLSAFAFDGVPAAGGVIAQMRGTGPMKRRFAAQQCFVRLIHAARREIVISTPYFVPDQTVQEALCSAAYAGIAVTLIVPARNDSRIVSAASRSYYPTLLAAGVKIYEFLPGLLHAKTMVIDGVMTNLGSSNLDIRSFDLNSENDMLVYDEGLAAGVRRVQEGYIAQSCEIGQAEVARWSLPRRIWQNTLGTLGPIL